MDSLSKHGKTTLNYKSTDVINVLIYNSYDGAYYYAIEPINDNQTDGESAIGKLFSGSCANRPITDPHEHVHKLVHEQFNIELDINSICDENINSSLDVHLNDDTASQKCWIVEVWFIPDLHLDNIHSVCSVSPPNMHRLLNSERQLSPKLRDVLATLSRLYHSIKSKD